MYVRSECDLVCADHCSAYFAELEKSIEFVRKTPDLSIDEKRKFFKNANANLGAFCGIGNRPALTFHHLRHLGPLSFWRSLVRLL